MDVSAKLDDRLLRALSGDAAALPGDIASLTGYLRLIQDLLGERAVEHEPSWALACASAAEIETLQALETTVVERAIGLRVGDLDGVLTKLAIWRQLGEDSECRLRDRLILSLEDDLRRLARAGRG